MENKDMKKMFNDVFAPKSGEKVLIMTDMPHDAIPDSNVWKERRIMTQDWDNTFIEMGNMAGFSVDLLEYKATGQHNTPIPAEIIDIVKRSHLVIAMTEYSATSSLATICHGK